MDGLSYLLYGFGIFYCLSGTAHLLPQGQIHTTLNRYFVQYAKVFPLRSIGYQPDPIDYQFVIGMSQLIAGVLIWWGPIRTKQISCVILLVEMVGAAWTLLQLGDPSANIALPSGCAIGLLILLLNKGSKIKLD
ncbi:transmembrane protein 35B-like [Ptychodera flava]|uniref:transmembrane protein 35B-like n=1 Tax=Ptychodera flava TaxID=63121 RepID=UPI00396A7A8A